MKFIIQNFQKAQNIYNRSYHQNLNKKMNKKVLSHILSRFSFMTYNMCIRQINSDNFIRSYKLKLKSTPYALINIIFYINVLKVLTNKTHLIF